MDLPAIKAASRADLLACTSAASRNVLGLLRDAEMLAGSSTARANSLAALAVEECGKALCLTALALSADEADRLKRRGLYVDIDRTGRICEPSDITEAELASQLTRARQAAVSAALLLGPDAQARLANPPAEVIELASTLVNALSARGHPELPRLPPASC